MISRYLKNHSPKKDQSTSRSVSSSSSSLACRSSTFLVGNSPSNRPSLVSSLDPNPTLYPPFESERGQQVSLARRFVRQPSAEEHGTRANAFLPTARPPEQSILPVRHRARSRWRAPSCVVLVRHVHDHVVEIRQELWIEQGKDPLVQLSRVPGGHHVMIPARLVPPIELVEGAVAMPAAKIVEAVRAAAAVILKPVHRRLHQRRLGVLPAARKLVIDVPPSAVIDHHRPRIVGGRLPGRGEELERPPLAGHALVSVLLVPCQLVNRATGARHSIVLNVVNVVRLVVVVVVVVAIVWFREVRGGRGGGRRAGTRWVLRQASDGPVSSSISYVRLLHLLHRLVLRRRVRVLAVRVFGRHVQHQVDGLVVEPRRLGALRQPVQLLPLLRRLRIRRAP